MSLDPTRITFFLSKVSVFFVFSFTYLFLDLGFCVWKFCVWIFSVGNLWGFYGIYGWSWVWMISAFWVCLFLFSVWFLRKSCGCFVFRELNERWGFEWIVWLVWCLEIGFLCCFFWFVDYGEIFFLFPEKMWEKGRNFVYCNENW